MAYVGRKRAIVENYDLSGRAESTSVGYVVVCAQTLRGKVGVPYMFNKYDEYNFIQQMGDTTDLFTGPAECLAAIKNGANLIVFRAAHYTDISDAATCTILPASANIPDRGGVPTAGASQSAAGPFLFQLPIAGQVDGDELGPFIFATDTNDKFKIRVRHNSVWGTDQTVTFAAAETTAQVTCDQINAQTSDINATVSSNKIHIETTDANDDVEVLTVTNDSYSTIGVSEAVYNHTTGTIGLSVSIDGEADQDFEFAPLSGETTTFYLTSAQVATQMSALTDGTVSGLQGKVTITSSTTGTDSTVQVQSTSTALSVLGFDSTEHAGASGAAVNAWKLELTGPGAYGNSCVVYFYDNPLNPGDRMDYRRITPGEREVYYPNLSRDPDDPYFWKNYINMHDEGVTITDLASPNAAPYDWPALNSAGITLSGGSDGTTTLTDADWIGHSVSKTGFYAIDKVRIPIIHFMCFGTTSNVVHEYAKIWAESRIAKFYHGVTPPAMTAAEAVDYREGNAPDYTHAAFNSPSMTLTTKEPVVYDSRNNGKVVVSGLPFLAASITRTEEVYGPGISPFGVKRGQCPGVIDIEDNVDEDSAAWDLLSLHNINSVVMLKNNDRNQGNEGTYLWGGYTMQKNPSKMQDFAVVWLLKAYELRMYPILQRYIHDPNKPGIWGELKREMAPMFREDLRKDKFAGIFMNFDDGSFFADGELKGATLNTGDSMDRGEYICRILIKPYSQIGWPIAQIGTMRSGDPWATYATMAQLPNYIRL
jgi:hypothetical protein